MLKEKLKKNKIEKEKVQEEKQKKKITWKWQLASVNKWKDMLLKKNKCPAPIYVIMCSVDCAMSNDVINFLNNKGIVHHVTKNCESKVNAGLGEIFGAYTSEKDFIIGLADAKLCENLVFEMTNIFQLNCNKNDFACLLKPNSASLEVLKFILGKYNVKENKDEKN